MLSFDRPRAITLACDVRRSAISSSDSIITITRSFGVKAPPRQPGADLETVDSVSSRGYHIGSIPFAGIQAAQVSRSNFGHDNRRELSSPPAPCFSFAEFGPLATTPRQARPCPSTRISGTAAADPTPLGVEPDRPCSSTDFGTIAFARRHDSLRARDGKRGDPRGGRRSGGMARAGSSLPFI
jgi:hypothetical protein